ncbi:MAG: sigma-70 family RNA polymerase sigma factor [Anaerolineaceae bacterium]|nr:sigma-70 family RNA polymerase sigma factor [Anaerolineaceae bacterium]
MVKTQNKVFDERESDLMKNPESFELIYRQYVNQVFGYLYSILGNVQDAEDACAQTFLVVYESLPRYQAKASFKSWLFRIARNKAMDHFRKRKKIVTGELHQLSVNDDALSQVIQSEQTKILAEMMKGLPEEDIELLRLRFLAQMTFTEMADFLGRKEDTVKKSVYRLIGRLQKQVEGSHA